MWHADTHPIPSTFLFYIYIFLCVIFGVVVGCGVGELSTFCPPPSQRYSHPQCSFPPPPFKKKFFTHLLPDLFYMYPLCATPTPLFPTFRTPSGVVKADRCSTMPRVQTQSNPKLHFLRYTPLPPTTPPSPPPAATSRHCMCIVVHLAERGGRRWGGRDA